MFGDIEIMNWGHPLFYITALVMGCCVGSYLNVVIYRLPLGLSTNDPKRSFCPTCKLDIPFYRNIPIITWIIQAGKCSGCKNSIAVRYLLVELLTGLIWLGLWWYFAVYSVTNGEGNYPNFTWYPIAIASFYIVLFTIGIAIFFIDIEHLIIPRELSIGGGIVALMGAILLPWHLGEQEMLSGLVAGLIGGVVAYAALWSVVLLGKLLFGRTKINVDKPMEWHIREADEDSEDVDENLSLVIDGEDNFWHELFFRKSDKLRMSSVTDLMINGKPVDSDTLTISEKKISYPGGEVELDALKSISGKVKSLVIPREAMGMGDVHLLGVIGLMLGVNSIILVVLAACVIGILIHFICKAGLGKQMPFAPSLLLGAAVWIFFGEKILNWYNEFLASYLVI